MTELAAGVEESDALPRRFGQYVLFDKIGEGGMARIFLARELTELGAERLVVVKEILPLLSASSEMSKLLVDEAKLCAALSHKNVVQVTNLGRDNDRLYIAMEYVEGLDLRDLLRGCSQKKVPLPVQFSLFVVTETLRALDYAHRKRGEDGRPLGIVHRDVSPSNVLLSVEGEVKLCDFGIARVLTSGGVLPEEAIQGKAGYMSPEAARGEGVDARSDVFAAGIVLFELLAGHRLYRSGKERPSPLEQARQAAIPPLPSRGNPDEERLFEIVRKALATNPDERYRTAQAMLSGLEAYTADNRLGVSALKFGTWLMDHFGGEIVERRRERERSAKDLDESSGRRPSQARALEATPDSARPLTPDVPVPVTRNELPTLPDPDVARVLPRSVPPPPLEAAPKTSTALLVAIVLLVVLVFGTLGFLFGRK